MKMMTSPPSPPDDHDEIFEAMEKLLDDSRVVRSAHFIAAERKDKRAKLLGVTVIVLNLLITSGLVEIVFPQPNRVTAAIKLLSFLAGALAAIQTFLSFQKEVECHRKSGGIYSSINHRTRLVMAEYKEEPDKHDALVADF